MKRTVYWIMTVCACILVLGMLGCSCNCTANNDNPSDPKHNVNPAESDKIETVTHAPDDAATAIPDSETNVPQTPDVPEEPATPEVTEEPDIDIPVTLAPGETRQPTPIPNPTPTPDENVSPSPTPDTSDIELPEV